MSAVRPSPISRAQIRQASRSPSLKPVFAGTSSSRYDPPGREIQARIGSASKQNYNEESQRVHRSDPCLIERQIVRNKCSLSVPENIDPESGAGVRRRLFDSGNLHSGEFELIATNSGTMPGSRGFKEPARQVSLSKSRSTTLCGLENIQPTQAVSDLSLKTRSSEQSLRCRTDSGPGTASRVPISPGGSQRSQDSGFSDSDSQSDERRAVDAAKIKSQQSHRNMPRPLRYAKSQLSKSSFSLIKGRNTSSSVIDVSMSRQKSRAGHTPKPRRFAKSRLQVMSERQEASICSPSSSFRGPLTSSPVSANHVLQCSAVERELDSILDRVDQADFNQHVTIHRGLNPNDTNIDFQSSCLEVDSKLLRSPAACSVNASVRSKSRSGMDPFFRKLAGDLRVSTRRRLPKQSNSSVICVSQVQAAPVRSWLNQQLFEVENECMNMLQSKSVISDISHLLALSARHARTNIRDIQVRAKSVSTEFTTLFKELELVEFAEVPGIVKAIDDAINSFIEKCSSAQGQHHVSQSHLDNLDKLRSLIRKMSDYVSSCGLMDRTLKIEDLMQVLTSLAQAFNHLVDWMLGEEVKVLLSALTPDGDILCLKLALRSVSSVALDGARLCRILVAQGVVARLTDIAKSCCRQLRSQTLRALATVCCVGQGVKAFEKADGLRLVTRILTDPLSTEEQRSECAGIIAQVTSPSSDTVHDVQSISHHLEDIVRELTGLAATTDSAESLLMASAALANLTFLNIGAVRLLQHNGTAGVLVQAVSTNDYCSMFVKDQTATVLANMASIVECHTDILRCGGLTTLLSFVHEQVLSDKRREDPAVQAVERVLQKAAIALSRLCVSQQVSLQLVQSGALTRLVQLCRDGAQRNCSDGVLVACLTTLRKVAAASGPQVFRDVNGLDLVEPRLLESFLICSTRQESCV